MKRVVFEAGTGVTKPNPQRQGEYEAKK